MKIDTDNVDYFHIIRAEGGTRMEDAVLKYPIIDMDSTGKQMKKLCLERGINVKDLSVILNVSHQAIYKWFAGKMLPSLENMLVLAFILDVKIEDMIVYKINEQSYCNLKRQSYYVREVAFSYNAIC